MKQFDLSLWLQDKSHKIVTRDGRPVRIVCWDLKCNTPIIAAIQWNQEREDCYCYNTVGWCANNEGELDLFFADEEEKLTEFDYAVLSIISDHNSHTDSIEAFAKRSSKKLLDLARKELEKNVEHSAVEFAKSYMEDVNPSFEKVKESEELWKWKMSCLKGVNKAYAKGEQDALKDLPKWKKATKHKDLEKHIAILEDGKVLLSNYLEEGDYYIDLDDLKTLPKEE